MEDIKCAKILTVRGTAVDFYLGCALNCIKFVEKLFENSSAIKFEIQIVLLYLQALPIEKVKQSL